VASQLGNQEVIILSLLLFYHYYYYFIIIIIFRVPCILLQILAIWREIPPIAATFARGLGRPPLFLAL